METCPVIVFASEDFNALPQMLRERLFDWSKLINKPPGQHAMALGYGSVYNYANPANLRYCAMRSTFTITFVAARDIQMGEELTINYDEPSGFDPSPVSAWMSRHGITPV